MVAIGNLAAPAAAFVSAPILAHALGVDGRGEVAAGTAMLLLGTAIGTLGISDAATYFVASRTASPGAVLKRGTWYLAGSGLLLTVLSGILAPVLAAHDPELTNVIRIAGLAITPTLMLGALRGVAQGMQQWALVNAEKYLTAVFRVVPLLVLLVLDALTPLTAVVVLAGAPIIGGLAYFRLLMPPRLRGFPLEERPPLIRYGLHVWIGSLSGIVLSRVDQTLMTPLAGVYELGLYAVAVNLADLLLIGQSALGQVLFSVDAGERKNERLYLGARLSVAVSAVLALGLGIPAVFWVRMLFGPEFEPAVLAVWILLLAHVIGAAGSVAGVATSARGRPALRSTAIAVAALVNLALLVALVPTLGAIGAAVATLCGSGVGTVLNLYFARRSFGMSVTAFCFPRPSDVGSLLRILRRR
ncbi:oligosaccharide flippase family protein [Microbacterium sp. MAHUQ-60]|uniref:oligosaccharide flippase family protein n=1 Tax=unclassified Microbacterium TaxID=2609290 RepID=UPI00361EE750